MTSIRIEPARRLRGDITLPGDKSISHRAALLAALSAGRTTLRNFLFSDDCLVTLSVLGALGVGIRKNRAKKEVVITSSGRLCPSRTPLFMKESGTSARIFLGLLAGQDFSSKVFGAPSLNQRPMRRVLEPLRLMGARIQAARHGGEEFLPIEISPSVLRGIHWRQRVASAQVKSAILLAALCADGATTVAELRQTRDHTERMLELFGADISRRAGRIRLARGRLKSPGNILIPGDISSAAFFIAAALLVKGSHICIRDVSVNPTRLGLVSALKRMGGRIRISNRRGASEPVADIEVEASRLRGIKIMAHEIPGMIDELPILMVVASFASGKTVIHGVRELRVKETDRIRSMEYNLSQLNVNISVKFQKKDESIEIVGMEALACGKFKSFGDHRTAMSMVVAGLAGSGTSFLDDISCVRKSFPEFTRYIRHLVEK